MDFSKFDSMLDMKALEEQRKKAVENARTEYEEAPTGRYKAKMEKIEIGTTKDSRPMFKVQMRLTEGLDDVCSEYLGKYRKKPCVFMNKVIAGTKNDASMISSVEGWLAKIFPEEPIVFQSYSQFAEEILDAAEECESFVYEIYYDKNAWNNISIIDCY